MSTSPQGSSEADPAVVDTVILRYFSFVDETSILLDLVGRPAMVPRVVFDPDETQVPEEAMSEITRSIFVQTRTAKDTERDERTRSIAQRNAQRLRRIADLHSNHEIEEVDLSDEERELFARLLSHEHAQEFDIAAPLQAGEAACVALAVARGWTLVTNDTDALRALRKLRPKGRHARIRALLIRAASEKRITKKRANEIHREMTALGLWDKQLPFPDEEE